MGVHAEEKEILGDPKSHPENWMFCQECNKTFSIYKTKDLTQTILHICCPYCSSEEILGYTEMHKH